MDPVWCTFWETVGQTTYVTFRLVYSYNPKAIWKTKEVTYTKKLHTVLHRFTGAPVLVVKNEDNSTKSTVSVFAVFVYNEYMHVNVG